jgi:hypothetical protein
VTHEQLSSTILGDLLNHFIGKGFSAATLKLSYVGLTVAGLQDAYCANGRASVVDFDLVMEELEEKELIGTGPMAAYNNPPGSNVVLIGLYSKREYAYLTEAGYKKAQKNTTFRATQPGRQNVHISGGTFNHSPIGVGANVTQSVSVSNQSEAVTQLMHLLAPDGQRIDAATHDQITHMVDATQQGNLAIAKPLFQTVFGAATEGVKSVAWGVLTALIAKHMGLS